MPTMAIMFTISTYGTWLRGDARDGWMMELYFRPIPNWNAAIITG